MIQNLRTYFKFLSRNKFYSFVSIFGFSVSLMFVILLGLYTKQELSVDDFHEKKDRIFLMTHDHQPAFSNSTAPFVQELCPEIEAFCRLHFRSAIVAHKGKENLRADCLLADSTFFNVFSFKLIEGDPNRVLLPNSIVLTKSFAHKLFGKEDPIGKSLQVDDKEHTITGVMEDIPQNTHLPQADFLVSYTSIVNYWDARILTVHNNFGFSIYFLEKEGANISSKIPFLLKEFKEHLWLYRDGFEDKLEFIPLNKIYFEAKAGGYFFFKTNNQNQIKIYIAIGILIFVVAMFNYINMTVAQAGLRGKETAVKKLFGSSKKKIFFQLLSESFFMSLVTFGLGLLLAFVFEPYFNEILTTKIELQKQLTVVNVCAGILFIAFVSLISGIFPALVISRFNPLEVVKGTFNRKIKTSYSKALIIFQNIAVITLLICSFFIKQQSNYLVNYDLGYKRDAIFTMGNSLATTETAGFKSKLLSISGIEKVSFSCGTPMDGGNNNSFEKDGIAYSTQEILCDEDFFDIYGITTNTPNTPFTDESLYISRAMFDSPLTDKQKMTLYFYGKLENITGVLGDIHIGSLECQEQYLRLGKIQTDQMPWNISIKIDSSSDQFAIADKIQKEYIAYTGGKIPNNAQFVDSIIQNWYKKEQNLSQILSAFTLLTIIISVMGVLAMSLYLIKQKEKEIGVRKVNGATEGQVLWMLNKESLKRVLVAFILACPIAYYATTKWLEDFPYHISLNWWTFALAGGAIALLTLASVSYMTWKAARANPVDSLKSE